LAESDRQLVLKAQVASRGGGKDPPPIDMLFSSLRAALCDVL